MGQLALGLRSLVIRLAVFFVMAALLAWALGGTLLPRAEEFDYATYLWQGTSWHWRQSIGGRVAGGMSWQLMTIDENGKSIPFDSRTWVAGAGPIVTPAAMYYAARHADGHWMIEAIDGETLASTQMLVLPDRLTAEQQLARIEAGLELQDLDVILRQRADSLLK